MKKHAKDAQQISAQEVRVELDWIARYAAETWDKLRTATEGDPVEIIRVGIEKAINAYDAELDRIQNGKGQGIIHESRTAHAKRGVHRVVIYYDNREG